MAEKEKGKAEDAGSATATATLDPVFEKLPADMRTALSMVPTPLNSREEKGTHLSPRMGRLIKAFRSANGNVSQKELAEKKYASEKVDGKPLVTTHCQIATLEQGGCKKGANPETIALLAHALKVKPEVISAINEADLQARAATGDEQAKKILGIAEEEAKPPETVAKEEAEKEGDVTAEPTKAGKKAESGGKPVPTPVPAKDAAPVSM